MAHGDAREGKWRGNWRMEWVARTPHTTSEHYASSITTADAHTSAVSSRLNWRPRRFKWTRPFRRKTKSGFCACAITFQTQSTKQQHLITQGELNELVRNFELRKTKAQLLGSRLQQWKLLEKDVKVSFYRKFQSNTAKCFSIDCDMVYCNDVCGLMEELQLHHNPEQRRFFIDTSKACLKAILLHNGNKQPSIPLAHAVRMKRNLRQNLRFVDKYVTKTTSGKLSADLKVVALLTGLQWGCTESCCFLCEWDSWTSDRHCHVKQWPLRGEMIVGQKNVAHRALVD